MKHPERKDPLNPGDLVLVEFHGIDTATAIVIILGIGPEDA